MNASTRERTAISPSATGEWPVAPGSHRSGHSDALRGRTSAVEHRPADVVAQPLVIKDELADHLRELMALPLALESPCGLAQAFRCRGPCSLARVGGRAELMRGDVSARSCRPRSLPLGSACPEPCARLWIKSEPGQFRSQLAA